MTERERDRHARHRLAIIRHAQEVTGNVSKTCRYYGITRTAYYKWLRRYEEGGPEARMSRTSWNFGRPPDGDYATRLPPFTTTSCARSAALSTCRSL